MTSTAITSDESKQLSELMADLAKAAVGALTNLVGTEPKLGATELLVTDVTSLRESFAAERTVAIGGLDQELAGSRLRIVLDSTDAATLAGKMMNKSEADLTTARAAQKLEEDDFAAFGEVASLLVEGIDAALGETTSVQLEQHSVLAPDEESESLGHGATIVLKTSIELGDLPATELLLGIDAATATAWNGQPIAELATFDENFDNVPTRGTIACYLADGEPYDLVRRACRRVGLDIDHRPVSEVPNPAAYRGRLVLVDVPIRGDRRFEWCKRLKAYDESCRVVLMLRQPSRQRVVEGFLAKPDILIGWPIAEPELAAKLDEAFAKLDQPNPV